MAAVRPRFAAASFFTALALWATWPLPAQLGRAVPSDSGDPILAAWILGWDADRLRHLFRGLWDAPIFFPYRNTLAFSEHLLGIAIPVAPLVWLADSPLPAYNVAFIGSFVLASYGMYLLAHELTGRRDAALVAGLIFGFAPPRLAQISHLQVLMTGWMPIALLMLHRFLERGSRRALAGFVASFLVQAYSNGYYLYFLGLASAIVVLGHGARDRSAVRTAAGPLAIAAAAIVAAMLPIAWVYLDARQTYGQLRSELDLTTFGADLGAYLRGASLARPRVEVWRWLPSAAKPLGPEGELFPGAAALLLAAIGFWPSGAPSRWRTTYAALGAVALVLSMGIAPTAWGAYLPVGAVYRWLFEVVPGFDGLRVPARLSVLVLLSVAVAAGFGFVRVTARLAPGARAAACAGLAALIVLEGTPRRLPVADIGPGGRPDRAVYAWVRDHEQAAVLELPAGALDAKSRGALYGYQTLFHGRRVVNGFGGYDSPLQAFIGGVGSPLLDIERLDSALAMLRAIGVGTIVFRADGFADPAVADALLQALRADRAQVTSEAVFPGVSVFRLAPPDGNPVMSGSTESGHDIRVVSGFSRISSHANDRLDRAFDGDPDTRWLTGVPQSGDEFIDIVFDRPRDIARVRILTTVRSLSDYPRELLVEASDGSDAFTVLYRGSIVEQLGRGLTRDPRTGPIDIDVVAEGIRRLRLRQLGRTRTWFWSVDELQIFERR